MSPSGERNLSFYRKNIRIANYFQIERKKSYDYFLTIYITKLQSKFGFVWFLPNPIV